MDGSKKTVTYSLQKKLSVSLSLVIMCMGLLSGCYAYYTAQHDAIEWQDNFLLQILHINQKFKQTKLSDSATVFVASDEPDTNLYVVQLPNNSRIINLSNSDQLTLPAHLYNGLQTVRSNNLEYRLAIGTLHNGDKLIVAQSTQERNESATSNALRAALPIMLIVPLVMLLLKYYLARLFKPISQTSRMVNKADYQALSEIPTDNLPTEIHVFIHAINELLGRVSQYVAHQQRFIAEAAHELRSPLTALSLQAERLEQFDMSDSAKLQLAKLKQGLDRNRNLVVQLLTMARIQADPQPSSEAVSIADITKQVIEQLYPIAEQKHLDIGVISLANVHIHANELEIQTLIKNLVENAIKYSQPYTAIDINLTSLHDELTFTIIDGGLGISTAEQARILDPFYRVSGNQESGAGLGLSIVKLIIDKIQATIQFENMQPRGLKVTVNFNKQNSYLA